MVEIREKNNTEKYNDPYYCNVEKIKETIKNRKEDFEKENDCIGFTKFSKSIKTSLFAEYLELDYLWDKHGDKYIKNEDIPCINKWMEEVYSHVNCKSAWETDVIEYIKTFYNGLIEQSNRTIIPGNNGHHKEIDIYLPDIKLGIECNGIWFHAIENRGYKEYHQYKTEECRKQGINLLHIYDIDWRENSKEIKNLIKQCIEGTFRNELYRENNLIIGDNEKPVFGKIKILKITEPELIEKDERCHIYNCGKIYYEKI